MKTKVLIDGLADDDDLELAIKRRLRWVKLLSIPAFKARVENPRTAARSDIIKVYRRRANGDDVRFGTVISTRESTDRLGRPGTEYFVCPVMWSLSRAHINGIIINDCGHGTFIWLFEPGEFGVYKVEIVGSEGLQATRPIRKTDGGPIIDSKPRPNAPAVIIDGRLRDGWHRVAGKLLAGERFVMAYVA